MNTSRKIAMIAMAAALLSGTAAEAQRVHVRGANGVAAAGRGPNGTTWVRGRGHATAADGTVTSASGGAIQTANGARAARASTTTVNPDGSVAHSGGFTASGAKGSVTSTGSYNRAADGTRSGSRTTTATGAGGITYQGTTSIDPATGKPVHSYTCTDASGTTVSCPR